VNAPAVKTAAQRNAEMRARRAALGLSRLEVAAHPDDYEAIKRYAAKLRKKRERASAG
jgi:hypothetical protein